VYPLCHYYQFSSLGRVKREARRYDSAVCCGKMSRDAFLSEALSEADKALENFALKVSCSAAGVCVFTRWWTEQTVNRK